MENNRETYGGYQISVIVPVYNVEQYLKRCVDSILAQTAEGLEIILVDDGSTDGSGALCDAYAAQYGQIRVHHKKNGGLTSAWKAGLALASGKYTGFVDSDDWIDPDMYERMLALAEREQADMTVCGLVFDFEDPRIPKREEISNFRREVYSRREVENLFPTLINDGYFFGRTLQPARVTKLFRTELLRENARMPLKKLAEQVFLSPPAVAARMGEFPAVHLRGLMAIPPISQNPGDNCKFFAQMRNLFVDIKGKKCDNVSMDCLSMGMSDDFTDAIAEGSTMIRVGTAIFGARHYG